MKNYKEYARHIYDEIIFIEEHCGNLDFDSFDTDAVLKRAVVRSLEIIGEAVKNIPEEVKKGFPETAWSDISKMRDRLIHHYFGIDYMLVWNVVTAYLPGLKKDITALLQ